MSGSEAAAPHDGNLWRELLHLAPVGIAVFDRDMRYVEVNARWKLDYGLAPDRDLVGLSHYEVFPEIPEQWRQIHRRCLNGAVEGREAERFVRADGKVDWVRWEIRPWHDAGGAIAGIVLYSEVITAQIEAVAELKASEARYRALIEQAPEAILIYDPSSRRFVDANRQAQALFGCGREQLLAQGPAHLRGADFGGVELLKAGDAAQVFECVICGPDQAERSCEARLSLLPTEAGHLIRISIIDITSRKLADADLRQAAIVFDNTNEGILITDAARNVVAVNAALVRMTGLSREQMIGHNPRFQKSGRHDADFYRQMWDSLEQTGQWRGELWNRRSDGVVYPVWENISAVRDPRGTVTHYVAVISDISAIKRAEKELQRLAYHDSLTGLPNRLQMAGILNQSLQRAKREGGGMAVLFIDLDNFKLVNDSLGHAAGDTLLQEVGRRLQRCVRAEDTVARLGGDEFTVLLADIKSAEDAAGVAQKIIAAVRQPIEVEGRLLTTSASIGISVFPEDASSGEDLTRYADAALYRAKTRGRNTFVFYSPKLTEHAAARLNMEHGLRRALGCDELMLYFQPQYTVANSQLCGMEALLRWRTPQGHIITPSQFIAFAEESSLIEELGDWVLDQACRQIRSWIDAGLKPVRTAINVSGRQITQNHLAEKVQSALARYRLGAGIVQLEVELTETTLMALKPARNLLARLHALGVMIAIDDFGTGFSSLGLLQHLPVNAIKIAQNFVAGIPHSADSVAIVSAVLAIGRSLRLRVVAEGVETRAQFEFLREQGCDEIQGHLLSPALPPEQAALLLAAPPAAGPPA